MSRPRIKLSYGMDTETRLYDAWFDVTSGTEFHKSELFERTFSQVMTQLARFIRDFKGDVDVVLHRTEVKDSQYKLDEETVKLLNDDPAMAVRTMTVPDRIIYVRDNRPERISSGLLTGHDVLANAFGDSIYCRNCEGRIEDPVTGRWIEPMRSMRKLGLCVVYDTKEGRIQELHCTGEEGWYRIKTEDLLRLKDVERYFLPRKWNKSGPWISHEDLKQMYETYCKERADVSSGQTSGSPDP